MFVISGLLFIFMPLPASAQLPVGTTKVMQYQNESNNLQIRAEDCVLFVWIC